MSIETGKPPDLAIPAASENDKLVIKIIPPEPKSVKAEFPRYHLTDWGNAERLVTLFGNILRYCPDNEQWYHFNNHNWVRNNGTSVEAYAKETIQTIYHEAGDCPDEKLRLQISEHARKSESGNRLKLMLEWARSEAGVSIHLKDFDSDPWFFNVTNGTIYLRTGELITHLPEHNQSIIIPIEYDKEAQCPLWLKCLDEWMAGNKAKITYLQRAVGYSLTGDTREQKLFFLHGLGANGKSTFLATVRKLLGDYADRVNTDLFMVRDKNYPGPKEGLANLRGKRMIIASEIEDGRGLATSLIKDLTGGETVKADRKYEHEIEYMPVCKIWLSGNHKPVIKDSTLSIWRRMKLIPFTVTIPDSEMDPKLTEKLEDELSGILNWAVQGCIDWQGEGLGEPEAVKAATAEYKHDSDILGDFLEDCCDLSDPETKISKSDLKDKYEVWCKANGQEPVTQRTFRARLIEKGIVDVKGTKGQRFWQGLTLATQESVLPPENRIQNAFKVARDNDIPENSPCNEKQEKFTENSQLLPPHARNLESFATPTTQQCPSCGGTKFWKRVTGEIVCGTCHPEPKQ